MANEHGSTTPRIASGNCSVVLTSTSSSNSGGSGDGSSTAIYDKQMTWKLHGQRKLQSKVQALSSREELECTFAPKTNTSKRRLLASDRSTVPSPESPSHSLVDVLTSSGSPPPFASADIAPQQHSPRAALAAPVYPTESQESSIKLHLVRQERAREHALDAQQRLFAAAQRGKDFTRVTTVEPFKLSVGNQKQRSSSVSPTKIREPSGTPAAVDSSADSTAQARCASRSKSFKKAAVATAAVGVPVPQAAATIGVGAMNHHHHSQQQPSSSPHESREDAWDRERASLVAVLDAQRRELEQRDRAQHDAMQVATSFAAAIERFEERLLVVESTTALELASVRELLQRQAAATELILQSLGITELLPVPPQPPVPSSTAALSAPLGSLSFASSAPSPWSPESPRLSSSVLRRETK